MKSARNARICEIRCSSPRMFLFALAISSPTGWLWSHSAGRAASCHQLCACQAPEDARHEPQTLHVTLTRYALTKWKPCQLPQVGRHLQIDATAEILSPAEMQGISAGHASRLLGRRCFPRGAPKLDWHVYMHRPCYLPTMIQRSTQNPKLTRAAPPMS